MSEMDLELPRDDTGNLNYDMRGKILTAKLIKEDASYVKVFKETEKESDYLDTGFVMESYEKEPHKTLMSYLSHIDTNGVPSVINNYMLNRHPLAIAKIRAKLEKGPDFASESLAASFLPESPQRSARYFEESVPTKDFVHGFQS